MLLITNANNSFADGTMLLPPVEQLPLLGGGGDEIAPARGKVFGCDARVRRKESARASSRSGGLLGLFCYCSTGEKGTLFFSRIFRSIEKKFRLTGK